LGALIVAVGLGMSNTSEFGPNLTEHLHIVADSFLIVGAGILLSTAWVSGASPASSSRVPLV
jgi:hypothetical protein